MVTCICDYPMGFYDMDVGVWRTKNEQWQTNLVRATDLINTFGDKKVVRIIKEG